MSPAPFAAEAAAGARSRALMAEHTYIREGEQHRNGGERPGERAGRRKGWLLLPFYNFLDAATTPDCELRGASSQRSPLSEKEGISHAPARPENNR